MSTIFDALKQREEKLLCRTYGRYPLAIERGEGARLYDFEGKEYIDLLAGIAVTNIGHCRPELADVMAEQARKLVHVSNLFYQEEQLELAEKILATCHFDKAFFCNSGAEANEAAIKICRRYTQRVKGRDAGEIITFSGAFHGRTLATVAATGQAKFADGFAPIPQGFRQVPWGDLAALEEAITESTAGVLVEVIQGEGGIRPMTEEFAKGVERICRKKDILFMVDEIQTGLCRTGKFWAHQLFDLKPDVMTCAKALANGLPMGAMLCSEEVAQGFEPGSHATTFGAGAVLSAVAAKVIDIMVDEKLADQARDLGEYAMNAFREIGRKCPGTIDDVRGHGLMIGIVLTENGKEIWEALVERGFILNLTQERVLRLVPPLVISKDDIDVFASALEELLSQKMK
ncbi:aspartate aminotransferase family protein [Halodesulfovibrio sp.]|jgi:acetylornithine aminotransferase|uniref:aspartate aminotransferase family protein n=1 Tax=Halodesulfovibrio sp. TaxID=1912772 RepID=UPI0025DF3503|nr:aspartate aminotransferase family protein [Halodesulfovibrio sp.]MCT4536140.1 aspartate aminotransferase family protein [Halodesulfovibrio sp.]